MKSELRQIISDIDSYLPTADGWLGLDVLLDKLFSAQPELGIDAMLRVFERFPEDDGGGVFWSIVHGLETLSGYEEKLVESVKSRPSEFGLLMVNRLLNANQTHVADTNLLHLLSSIAVDQGQPLKVRKRAQAFAEAQNKRAINGTGSSA